MAEVLELVDHKNLDLDVEYFKTCVSTTENLTIFLWKELKKHMSKPELLYKTVVHETSKNVFTFRGP
uniref:6-pyruvoyl tetrahydrobiopterin synthase n=1 Tax=Ascaris lumbricoides TaxID=6252 RepID=A0A0M3I247_ASCLU